MTNWKMVIHFLLFFATSLYIGAKKHLRMNGEILGTKKTWYLKVYGIIECKVNKLVQTFCRSFWQLLGQQFTSRNWPKCNHFICDYMQLLIICNYIWTFLELFLMLVIFATTLQLVCDYFRVYLSMWTTFSLVFIQEEEFMSHYTNVTNLVVTLWVYKGLFCEL